MKDSPEYLNHFFNPDDPDLISIIDELPLWSAPFGLKLLETIVLRENICVLDIGCGFGFPMIEIAQRLGNSSKVFGIDPWQAAIARINLKIKTYDLQNVVAIIGFAEQLPFDDNYFDLIVSNNGINNVEDIEKTLAECSRVSKPGSQFVLTMNLENTMIEFYNMFEKVLQRNGWTDEIVKMKEQIYSKRKPISETKSSLEKAGFEIQNIYEDSFNFKFVDATSMFNHSLIKYWFLDGWKKILKQDNLISIFTELESELNSVAESKGEITLTIPFVTIDCSSQL